MRRVLLAMTVLSIAGSLSLGAAASLKVTSDNLTTGVISDVSIVLPCDLDEIAVSYRLFLGEPQLVEAVEISGTNGDCETQTLSVVLADSTGNLIATAGGAVDNKQLVHTFTLDVAARAEMISEVSVTLVE